MSRSASSREVLGTALGRIPSGLFIVTSGLAGEATGFLASWVQQSGFEPPCVTVAIAKQRHSLGLITKTGVFAVSVIGKAQLRLRNHFARGFGPGDDAFDGIDTERAPSGLVYPKDAMAWLDCRVAGTVESGEHVVVVGAVQAGGIAAGDEPYIHVRKSGFAY
jgi:flavin reductase (DIM6/NTAB) family NADH-FMN oxidoreductase RutF